MNGIEHAVLSASSAHKWLVCTPSVRLEEQFENVSSDYMKEGTLAHAIAEFQVRSYFLEPLTKKKKDEGLNEFKSLELYNDEMISHTEFYLDYIKQQAMQTHKKPFITVEKRVDYSHIAPEGFGTADCIMIFEDTLHVIDFKYGKGVKVDAEHNSQMMLYALGAIKEYSLFYNIKNIKLSIVQPRLDNISEWECTVEELNNWAETEVKSQAQKAFMGLGEYVPGEHCKFCRAKKECKARAEKYMPIIETLKKVNPNLLTNEAIGGILKDSIGLDDFLKDLKSCALEKILKNEEIPGWKAVEGKSNRMITDVDKAFEVLEANGFEKDILFERKPLGLTALEKIVGKKKLTKTIGIFIEKPKGAPTLAPESDKREKYNLKSSAMEDFAE